MANVDMIPRSYREARRTERTLVRYGIALASVLLAGGAASTLLHWRLSVELPQLESLRGSSARVEAARTSVATAQARKTALEEEVAALGALRSVGALGALTDALDTALNDKVWLGRLALTRTQEKLTEPGPAPLPGVVVRAQAGAGVPAPGQGEAWRVVNNVEMRGSALDHASLTSFLGQTSSIEVLKGARFLESSVATGDEGQLMGFSIAGPLGPVKGQP